ncbi:MAG TPA: peptidylprolyl isomerase [Aquabacterium sp.]|nr:peptidylprolyl isomerase [Aquabacterium sp.]
MFDFVRKHNRILQFLLVLLILPSFVFFGVQSVARFGSDEGVVAKVDGTKVMQPEWDNANRQMSERIRAQRPDTDAKEFDKPEFKKQSLDQVVREYVLTAAARDQRLTPAPLRIQRIFETDPQFAAVRNADGTLNKDMLQARGMSPAHFEALLRQDLTIGQVLGAVSSSGQTSAVASQQAINALFQVRQVQWQKFDPKQYASQVNPTAAQLQAYYKDPANDVWLTSPEKADVQYVVLDLDTLKQRVSVSEDDLRSWYKENINRYTEPEERRASHILIKAEKSASPEQKKAAKAKAEQLLAELQKNPSMFAELAKKNSDDPGSAANGGDLDFFGRGAMTKPFEDAVFAMQPGQISGVVESDFGYHIIKLTAIRGGKPQPFEAVRAQIEDEARKQAAQRQYAEVAEQFTNKVYEVSDSLKPVADELKLPLQSATGILHHPDGKDQGVLSNPRLLDALFDPTNRSKGRNTEAIEVGPNKLVSARIVKYEPAAKLPFDQVQDKVREHWVEAESVKLARKDAQAKMALWEKSPEQATLPAPVEMSRRNMFGQPAAVLEAVLKMPADKLPSWQVIDLGAEGSAVVKLLKVLPPNLAPAEVREAQEQFGPIWGRAEADAYYRALQREYKVQYLNDGKKVMDAVTGAKK